MTVSNMKNVFKNRIREQSYILFNIQNTPTHINYGGRSGINGYQQKNWQNDIQFLLMLLMYTLHSCPWVMGGREFKWLIEKRVGYVSTQENHSPLTTLSAQTVAANILILFFYSTATVTNI